VPERANVTLSARTYNGSIRSSFQLTPPSGDDAQKRNKRMTVTLGNGSAHVELESFGGAISLRRPGEPRPETEQRRRPRERVKVEMPDIDQIVEDALAGAFEYAPHPVPVPVPLPMPMPMPVPRPR